MPQTKEEHREYMRKKRATTQQPGEDRTAYIKRMLADPLLIARIEREPNGCTPERWENALSYKTWYDDTTVHCDKCTCRTSDPAYCTKPSVTPTAKPVTAS